MSIKLNNGKEMPLVGFGCWKLNKDTTSDQIYNAVKIGYRLFDGAEDYDNEKEVGQGINRAIKDGLVSREELFITSKLWNSFHHPENAAKALERTLSDLNLDYVDLFLIHFPLTFKYVPFEEKYPPGAYCGDGDKVLFENVPIIDTWRAMEKMVESGKVKSIGISNFTVPLITDLLRGCKIAPAVLQIEHHPYLQQKRLVDWVQKQGIAITAYSSFGPQSYLELNSQSAQDAVGLFDHSTIKSISEKHGVSPSQVLLRWATQRKIAVIPKSNNSDRMLQNLSVNSFELAKEDLEQIEKLENGLRLNDPFFWANSPIFD